jgi:hypothetical protein
MVCAWSYFWQSGIWSDRCDRRECANVLCCDFSHASVVLLCCCQLENVRELEFESEEEEGQGDRRRILMVSNRCAAVRSALASLAEVVD